MLNKYPVTTLMIQILEKSKFHLVVILYHSLFNSYQLYFTPLIIFGLSLFENEFLFIQSLYILMQTNYILI